MTHRQNTITNKDQQKREQDRPKSDKDKTRSPNHKASDQPDHRSTSDRGGLDLDERRQRGVNR